MKAHDSKRPNILLLMTDQHRVDHVGWHPRSRLKTPHIDRIAQGVAFTNCVSVNPICTPARCALLTGKYAHQIGMLAMSGDLSQEHPTYPQALQRAGYWTAAVGKLHYHQGWPWSAARGKGHPLTHMEAETKRYGFDHLWEVSGKQLAMKNYCRYAEHLDRKGMLDAYRDHVASRGPNTNEASACRFTGEPWPFEEQDYVDALTGDHILAAIAQRPADKPFFLFGSFCGPHPPYDPPQRFLDMVDADQREPSFVPAEHGMMDESTTARFRKLRRAYKAMLLCIDEQVGRIFAALEAQGLLDSTVILFTSDHGEMLGERGLTQKQKPWWQSALVPTTMRHPQHLSGRIVNAPCELTDLTATILDLAGLDPRDALSKPWPAFHDRVPCRSLLPVAKGETDRVRDFAFSESSGSWTMIRSDRWQFVRFADPGRAPGGGFASGDGDADESDERLYDLSRDAESMCNVISDFPDQAAWCRRRLFCLLEQTPPAQTRYAPVIR